MNPPPSPTARCRAEGEKASRQWAYARARLRSAIDGGGGGPVAPFREFRETLRGGLSHCKRNPNPGVARQVSMQPEVLLKRRDHVEAVQEVLCRAPEGPQGRHDSSADV